MDTHIDYGQEGELLAIRYLKKKGYKIIEHNLRTCFGEVDIVAENHGAICFIEVKTRRSERFGLPKEAVTEYRKARYRNVAQWYMRGHDLTDTSIRFEVVEVLNGVINHIENAF